MRAGDREARQEGLSGAVIYWREARKVGHVGAANAFAIPALVTGRTGLCLTLNAPDGVGGIACGPVPSSRVTKPVTLQVKLGKTLTYVVLVPDGVTSVDVAGEANVRSFEVKGNAAVFTTARKVRSISW
jgi:hypothetical protein